MRQNETVEQSVQRIMRNSLKEQDYEYDKWRKEIPFMQFPSDWKIKIIPPFGGAVIRFAVEKTKDEWISVYLDCYGELGCMNQPYWEVYPAKDGDVERFYLNETDELLKAIQESLEV